MRSVPLGASSFLASIRRGSLLGFHQGDEIVLADALQHQEGGGVFPAVGDEVRALGARGVGLARPEPHFLLRILQEDAQLALQHVERVLHVVVIVPGHLLRLGELELLDAEAGAGGVLRAALDFVQVAAVLHGFIIWAPGAPRRPGRAWRARRRPPLRPCAPPARAQPTVSSRDARRLRRYAPAPACRARRPAAARPRSAARAARRRKRRPRSRVRPAPTTRRRAPPACRRAPSRSARRTRRAPARKRASRTALPSRAGSWHRGC